MEKNPNLYNNPENSNPEKGRILEINSSIEQLKIEKKQQKNRTDRDKKDEEIRESEKEKEKLLSELLEDIAYKSVHSLLSDKEQEIFDKNKEKIDKIIVEEKENSNKKAEDLTNKIKDQIETEDVKKEHKKLPEEEKQKIEFGLKTLGFFVEQKKNNFFAGTFNKILEKLPEGTASRFCKEMRDSFVRDSEKAQKTAEAITSGKEKHRIKNTSLFFGNILKYGRVVTDLTGTSLASPLRYVMMGGMVFTRASEAAKEARLNNEDVMEKTRITDIDKAEEEAWKIYERAKGKQGAENVSSKSLKDAYMIGMPKDLSERLKEPSTGNGFIQKILRKHLEFSIGHINDSIEKIHANPNLSPEEKEAKERKIIQKQEQKLRDYDRMLTQYGTVDGLAMAGRYAQLLGKKVVTAMTIETLYLSVEKMYEGLSDLFSESEVSPVLETNMFKGEQVEFSSRGAIQTIEDLKEKLSHQYGGDITKAPHSVQEFLKTNSTQEAIKLGFFDPNNTSGAESAMLIKGSTLEFDSKGNLLLHDIKTGETHTLIQGNNETVERYHGKMFDSDNSKEAEFNALKEKNVLDSEGNKISKLEGKGIRPLTIDENGHIIPDENSDFIKNKNTNINTLSEEDMPYEGEKNVLENKNLGEVEQKDSIDRSAAVVEKGIPEEFLPKEHKDVIENINTNTNNLDSLTESGKEIYKENINKMFPTEESMKVWEEIKNSNSLSAEKVMNMNIDQVNPQYRALILELKKLQEVTELDPMSKGPISPAETISEYMIRTMAKAGELGRLDEVKL